MLSFWLKRISLQFTLPTLNQDPLSYHKFRRWIWKHILIKRHICGSLLPRRILKIKLQDEASQNDLYFSHRKHPSRARLLTVAEIKMQLICFSKFMIVTLGSILSLPIGTVRIKSVRVRCNSFIVQNFVRRKCNSGTQR